MSDIPFAVQLAANVIVIVAAIDSIWSRFIKHLRRRINNPDDT